MLSTKGYVKALFISDNLRQTQDSITVDNNGVVGDKFYSKDSDRAILVSSTDSYDIAKENGINIEFGLLGENIVIDINPYNLSCGDMIKIGDTMMEVTINCTICNSLKKVDKKLPKLLAKDRGIFVKCIKSGSIKNGDIVEIVL